MTRMGLRGVVRGPDFKRTTIVDETAQRPADLRAEILHGGSTESSVGGRPHMEDFTRDALAIEVVDRSLRRAWLGSDRVIQSRGSPGLCSWTLRSPASAETIAVYLAAEAQAGRKVSTLDQRVAAPRCGASTTTLTTLFTVYYSRCMHSSTGKGIGRERASARSTSVVLSPDGMPIRSTSTRQGSRRLRPAEPIVRRTAPAFRLACHRGPASELGIKAGTVPEPQASPAPGPSSGSEP